MSASWDLGTPRREGQGADHPQPSLHCCRQPVAQPGAGDTLAYRDVRGWRGRGLSGTLAHRWKPS